jgi:hypothetical protein
MSFPSWLGSPSARGHRSAAARRCCRKPARRKPFLENLEDRYVLSGGGLVPSLVALGGANPTPIPLSASSLALDGANIGGPDVYLNFPGPATDPPVFGNEDSGITDFSGIYGGAAILGTGFDGQGNEGWWASDTRFMQGTYRGVDGNFYHSTFVEI